ncbi:MAG: helix-hairpin-helix domain-containing protein [Candidatus Omnitrophica bacterium]|nr:helix-hairpin-helix domain-containing protein [Candidatus Omnitrophota bacterium]
MFNPRRSSVLVIALFVLFFLSVLALSLGYHMQGSLKLTSRYLDRFSSFCLAQGVLVSLEDILAQDKEKNDYYCLDQQWKDEFMLNGMPRILQARDTGFNAAGKYKVSVIDEESKLNINKADKDILTNFLKIFQPRNAEELAQNIIDYRQSREGLKEFYSVYELLNIKGLEQKTFFGEDTNENKELDPVEDDGSLRLPEDNQNGVLDLGLKDFLTVHSEGKININTAPPEVLASIPGMNEDYARILVDLRKSKPFKSIDELKGIIVIPEKVIVQILRFATVQSNNFKIFVTAYHDDKQISREILAIVDRSHDKPKIVYWRQN